MKPRLATFLLAVGCLTAWLGLATPAAALSTVHLKNGVEIRGDVLSTRPDRIVVDLGFSVLTIPASEVERIVREEERASTADAETGDLFRTAGDQPALPVKENVDRCGEAVVQIRSTTGLGSGFLIHPLGYVVTNEHVVAGEYQLVITMFRRGEREFDKVQYRNVRIVALDARLDLALLKIEDGNGQVFPTVPVGDSAPLAEGQSVFAIGSPLGLERTVSQGIISQRRRALGGQLYLQTTAQINPGNSGGPLFNLRGEVVGVANMKAHAVGVEGVSFAIPAAILKEFLRNREAYAFDPRNPNAGFRYIEPPRVKLPQP